MGGRSDRRQRTRPDRVGRRALRRPPGPAPGLSRRWRTGPTTRTTDETYGLGTRSRVIEGERVFGHTGSIRGFDAAMWHFPDTDMTITVLTNLGRIEANPIVDALAAVAYPAANGTGVAGPAGRLDLAAVAFAARQPLGVPLAVADAAQLQQILDQQRSALNIPGAAAAVIFPDGSIWKAGSGLSQIAPDETATGAIPFVVGSITKTFVTAAIMQLADEGKLIARRSAFELAARLSARRPDHPARAAGSHERRLQLLRVPDLQQARFPDRQDPLLDAPGDPRRFRRQPVLRSRHVLPLQQHRLHPARPGHRAGHWATRGQGAEAALLQAARAAPHVFPGHCRAAGRSLPRATCTTRASGMSGPTRPTTDRRSRPRAWPGPRAASSRRRAISPSGAPRCTAATSSVPTHWPRWRTTTMPRARTKPTAWALSRRVKSGVRMFGHTGSLRGFDAAMWFYPGTRPDGRRPDQPGPHQRQPDHGRAARPRHCPRRRAFRNCATSELA